MSVTPEDVSQALEKENSVPFSRTIFGQTCCATVSGWFQVYSGGIAIDTVATRLQAGRPMSKALWGVGKSTILKETLALPAWQTERLLLHWSGNVQVRQKTCLEELACVTVATVTSTVAVCAAECPKILDQLKPASAHGTGRAVQQRETVGGVIRQYGFPRLMQGYTACFCREFLFNTAFLGSPAFAAQIRANYVLPNQDTSAIARCLDGKELETAALSLGLVLGFLTNAPDQLKTNIQKGQFTNMRQALAWQSTQPGGILGLFGRAAVWRSLYVAHAVVSMNFARAKVESFIDSAHWEESSVALFLARHLHNSSLQ